MEAQTELTRNQEAIFSEEALKSKDLIDIDFNSDISGETVQVKFRGSFLNRIEKETEENGSVTELRDEEVVKSFSFLKPDEKYSDFLPGKLNMEQIQTPSRRTETVKLDRKLLPELLSKKQRELQLALPVKSPKDISTASKTDELEKKENKLEQRFYKQVFSIEDVLNLEPEMPEPEIRASESSTELGLVQPEAEVTEQSYDRQVSENSVFSTEERIVNTPEHMEYKGAEDFLTEENRFSDSEHRSRESYPAEIGSPGGFSITFQETLEFDTDLEAFEEAESFSELIEGLDRAPRTRYPGETVDINGSDYGIITASGDDGVIAEPFEFSGKDQGLDTFAEIRLTSFEDSYFFDELLMGNNIEDEIREGEDKLWQDAIDYTRSELSESGLDESYLRNAEKALQEEVSVLRVDVIEALQQQPLDQLNYYDPEFDEDWKELDHWKKVFFEAQGIEPDVGEDYRTLINRQMSQESFNRKMGETVRNARRRGADKVVMAAHCNSGADAVNAMESSDYETPDGVIAYDIPNLTFREDFSDEMSENPIENGIVPVHSEMPGYDSESRRFNYDEDGNPLSFSIVVPDVMHFQGGYDGVEAYDRGFSTEGKFVEGVSYIFEEYESAEKRREGLAWLADQFELEVRAPGEIVYNETEFEYLEAELGLEDQYSEEWVQNTGKNIAA